MNLSQIVQCFDNFSDSENAEQLQNLDAAAAQLEAEPPLIAVAAMLRVFERFPDSDGFGVFWTLLHAIECAPGYETELVQSIARQPNEFNLIMVNRLLNAGVTRIGERSPLELLEQIAADARTPAEVKQTALELITLVNSDER